MRALLFLSEDVVYHSDITRVIRGAILSTFIFSKCFALSIFAGIESDTISLSKAWATFSCELFGKTP